MVPNRNEIFKLFGNAFFGEETRSDYLNLLQRTVVNLCDNKFKYVGPPYWFTDHGPKHSDSVFYYSIELSRYAERFIGKFNDQEIIGLACSCYLHDLAMAHIPAKHDLTVNGWSENLIDEVRKWHVIGVDEVLKQYRNNLKELYDRFLLLEEAIPMVCQAHGTTTHENSCQKLRDAGLPDFRGELLGKILLLSDELHLDYRRAILDHPQASRFPPIAKMHQFKHYYIRDIILQAPVVRIFFEFPEEFLQEYQDAFVKWTCAKLRRQVELVNKNMPGGLKDAFDLVIIPQQIKLQGSKIMASQDVLDMVKKLAPREQPNLTGNTALMDRPNHFDPNRAKPREQGPLYPILDRLMDELFREIDTKLAMKHFDKIYVSLYSNKKVAKELLSRVFQFSQKFKRIYKQGRIPTEQLFIITGRTGCGKSAFLGNLENEGKLLSRLPGKNRNGLLILHINCLNLRSFREVIKNMLLVLAEECRRSQILWGSLRKTNWCEKLRESRIATMSESTLISVLRGVLRHLHLRTKEDLHRVAPVVIVLDNIDRMLDFTIQKQIVEYAHGERENGYPFFIITLRNTTKSMIDRTGDYIAALPTNEIRSPTHAQLLSRRLKAAFSRDVLKDAESWCQKQEIHIALAEKELDFKDIRRTLEFAMKTLIKNPHITHPAFIPGVSGSNMRNALTLYRAIMKSIDPKELLKLQVSKKVTGEHYLIRTIAMERHPCYFASRSKIQNIFEPTLEANYFSKIYLLKIFEWLEKGVSGGEYLSLEGWINSANHMMGLPIRVIKNLIWNMLKEEFAYIEVESFEDGIPDIYHYIDDFPSDLDLNIRMSTSGKYYLEWLIYDISYLDCIMQDTLMDTSVAKALSEFRLKDPSELSGVFFRVYKFLEYLKEREQIERSSMVAEALSVSSVTPEIVRRIVLQRESLKGPN